MTDSRKLVFVGTALGLLALAMPADAQSVVRTPSANPNSPIVQAVTVPPGYTTYYISGTPAGPMPGGKWGDTAQQTGDSLNKLEASLKQLGLTFADVVKATVFLAVDPANGNKINFPAMNAEWSKRFGTAAQPHKPARSTIQVGLATPGALVEIEMIAVKK